MFLRFAYCVAVGAASYQLRAPTAHQQHAGTGARAAWPSAALSRIEAEPALLTRRGVSALGLGVLSQLAVSTPPARAIDGKVDPKDFGRLREGLAQINFLLDNWERETTNPTSGNADPDRVRIFLGLRTTDHPLFQVNECYEWYEAAPTYYIKTRNSYCVQVNKLLVNAQSRVADEDFEKWIEASEGFDSHVNKINELAYTSSFGESVGEPTLWPGESVLPRDKVSRTIAPTSRRYNPGGGKEQVAKYLNLAKEEVILARDSLKEMIAILKV